MSVKNRWKALAVCGWASTLAFALAWMGAAGRAAKAEAWVDALEAEVEMMWAEEGAGE